MPSRDLTPTLRTDHPNRYRQHPLANRILPPFAEANRPACPHPGCITIPNSYHPGPYCLAHQEGQDEASYMKQLDRELDRDARRAARAR
jgi:hypothetical protein